MNICFASNNEYKLKEIKSLLKNKHSVLSLKEIGVNSEIPETGSTLESNSLEKAKFVWDKYTVSCISDDTGLEVRALNYSPGVYSARYAGPDCLSSDNIALLLRNLEGITDRFAKFRTIITLIIDGKVYQFEGCLSGQIITECRGESGFGYDPVFLPEGYTKTLAEMTLKEKNQISHRAIATNKLVVFLNNLIGIDV